MNDPSQSCNVVFSSAIADWTEVNSSFDRGVLRIAYHGANRNKMYISKKAFNDAIKSVFNCPVVCNYIRKTDSIGQHDIEIINKDGEMRMVNITTPIGVVPESANVWWTEVTEDDGSMHEYLCADILIWKRQEAYEHIKENGITDESMEIRIIDGGKADDGLYHINKFEFTAFCLLESAPPCFESAGIEMFALRDFKEQYAKMMEDMRREFSTVITASADDIHTQSCSKGGTCELNVNELMNKYSLSAEDVTFDTTDMPLDEIERRFSEIKAAKDGAANFDEGENEESGADPEGGEPESGTDPAEDPAEEPAEEPEDTNQDDDDDVPEKKQEKYSLLTNQLWEELDNAVRAQKYIDPFWKEECCRYCMIDYDADLHEVYVHDRADECRVYGIPYSMNGDSPVLHFDARKRKKMSFVDFDEGEAAFAEGKGLAGLISDAHAKFDALNSELEALREFKAKADAQAREEMAEEVFSRFADLENNADFKALRENIGDMTKEQIEEKCFAIRGRSMAAGFSFSLTNFAKPIRLPIEAQAKKNADEPYGGIFAKYGIGDR